MIITDLKMPNADGFELLQWLKHHPSCAVIPTLVLSSSFLESDFTTPFTAAQHPIFLPFGFIFLRSALGWGRMKLLFARFWERLSRLSPGAIFAIGLGYVLAMGVVDQLTPTRMSLTCFYLLGAVFVGWGASKRYAAITSLLSGIFIFAHDWELHRDSPQVWMTLWNTSTRMLMVASAGWLTAELTRLNRHLSRLVEQRTATWKAEAQRHQATSLRLAQTLEQRRQAEEVLQTQACILEKMAEGMIATDPQGIIQMANPAADRLMGYAPGELLGKHITLLSGLPPAETAAKFQEIVTHLQHHAHWFGEVPQHRKDATSVLAWVEITRIQVGQRALLVALYQDITERKRLERHILEISDREQARIGQDLHDDLCQQLVSLAFDANALQRLLGDTHELPAARARRIADGLDQAITEARQLSRGLFPIRLETEGLPPALEELAQTVRNRSGVECSFECVGPVDVADRVMATHLYRIAQEAVNNALKHGQPKRITIELRASAEALELTIEDDGKGFPADAPKTSASMGLHIMDYRARTLGGSLRLAPRLQGGTIVTCRLLHGRNHLLDHATASPQPAVQAC